MDLACSLPCAARQIDFVRGAKEVWTIAEKLPKTRILFLSKVYGRNTWKNDFARSMVLIREVQAIRGTQNSLWLAYSFPLLHCPITLRNESKPDPEIRRWLAFADEKLAELSIHRS